MEKMVEYFKGKHPGVALDKFLWEKNMKKGQIALLVGEYPQTISAIITGKRSMNMLLSLKLEMVLGLSEGFFMILQVYYDISQYNGMVERTKPDISKFRKLTFSEVDIKLINWTRLQDFVIRRVIERGNAKELDEINKFYGAETVAAYRKKT